MSIRETTTDQGGSSADSLVVVVLANLELANCRAQDGLLEMLQSRRIIVSGSRTWEIPPNVSFVATVGPQAASMLSYHLVSLFIVNRGSFLSQISSGSPVSHAALSVQRR